MTMNAWLRYSVFRRLLPPGTRNVLEIGAGLGAVGSLLAREFTYVGLEPDPVSFATARERIGDAGTVLPISVEEFESTDPFDVVCAFEVLEHIEDERAALSGWQRHVRSGGWLFVSVPAGRTLGPTDLRQGHLRRYDREGLASLLHDVGLSDVTVVSIGFPIGYAMTAFSDHLARRRPHASGLDERTSASGRWMQPSGRNATIRRATAGVFAVVQRPFGRTGLGTGLVARARAARD